MAAAETTKVNPFSQRELGHVAVLDVDNGDYHNACDGVSNSMLSVFLDDPELFEGYYLSRCWSRPAPTPDMEFGTLVHAALLDGLDPLDCLIGDAVLIPAEALNGDGHRKGAAWKEFAAANLGKRLLKPEELAPLREMADRVREMRRRVEDHPKASVLLFESPGECELSFEWVDAATGLLLRARLDRLARRNARPLAIVDVKTTTSVKGKDFSAACWRYGYHRQAAFYRRGVRALTGETPPFVFIAIRKTPPYSVACYTLSEEFLEAGEKEVASALTALATCRDTDVWRSPMSDQIFTLDAPRWSKTDSEWEAV